MNGSVPRALVFPQTLGEREAVEDRHVHVQQHEVGPILERALEAAPAVLRLEHLDAGAGEARGAERPDARIVVDDQHAEPPGRQIGGTGRIAREGIDGCPRAARRGTCDRRARPRPSRCRVIPSQCSIVVQSAGDRLERIGHAFCSLTPVRDPSTVTQLAPNTEREALAKALRAGTVGAFDTNMHR